jgi:hypothetical protein
VIGADVPDADVIRHDDQNVGFFVPAITASNGQSGYGTTSHFAFGDLFP